jgi:predicted HicB family RNase H-like nuclease
MKTLINKKHKGYTGSMEISEPDDCLYGRIMFISDQILYEGQTPSELKAAFKVAVDEYIEMCLLVGKEPNKPLSGTFNIRVGADLHKDVATKAFKENKSLNEIVVCALSSYLKDEVVIEQHSHNHHHDHSVHVFLPSAAINTSDKNITKIESRWEMSNDRPC